MGGFCVTSIGFFVLVSTQAAKLPDSFKLCHKTDPNINECLRGNIEDAIRNLKNGAPEVGLSTFEPLHITQLIIGEGKGPVNVQQNFNDVKLHGLTGSKVLKAGADFDKIGIYAESITPFIRLEANYTMNGRVLLLPIVGAGPCNVTLVNTKINHTLLGEPIQRKGNTYMKLTKYTITLRPELVKFNFENLFNGNSRLGNELNNVLNDNWDAVFSDVREGYEKGLALVFQSLAHQVFTRVPLKNIFLD